MHLYLLCYADTGTYILVLVIQITGSQVKIADLTTQLDKLDH